MSYDAYERRKREPIAGEPIGFSFDLEILYLAARLGYRVAEVPVAWIDVPGSKVDPIREARRFVRDLITIKLNDLRGVYSAGATSACATTWPPAACPWPRWWTGTSFQGLMGARPLAAL